MSLRLRPWTVKRETALAFNLEVHRKLKKIQGAMWCVSIRDGNEIVGVALVGWPSQEQTNDEIDHLRVLRCTVKEGHKNGCSMLYGACWRAARAMGVESMDTFTHLDEPGTSLRAAGWIEDGLTSGGEHSRASRPRKPQEDARPKRRWWAPGSLKAPVVGGVVNPKVIHAQRACAIADALDEGELPMPGEARLGGRRPSERQREFDSLVAERDKYHRQSQDLEKKLAAIATLVSIYDNQDEPEGQVSARRALTAIGETIGQQCSICRSRHGSDVRHACE